MAFPRIINRHASRRVVCHRIASATAFIAAASAGCSPVFAQQSTSNGSVGIDVIALPRYAGSSAYQVLPLPELTFPIQSVPHTTLFAEGLDGGVAWSLTPNVDLGPLVGADLGRKQDDATVLNGTGDIPASFLYGAFVRWHAGPASADIRFLQSAHVGFGDHVKLDLAYAVVDLPQDRVTISADTVWANGPAQETEFGIDSEQAANSTAHLPEFSPSAGISRIDFKVALDHKLDIHWSVRAAAGVGTLVGDAANSPIVERRANIFGSIGTAYRF
jgi:outer membrane protein